MSVACAYGWDDCHCGSCTATAVPCCACDTNQANGGAA